MLLHWRYWKTFVRSRFLPLLIFCASVSCILVFNIPPTAIKWSVVVGLFQSAIHTAFAHAVPATITRQKWWQLLFMPRPVISLAGLMLLLAGFSVSIVVKVLYWSELTTFLSVAYALVGFGAGASAANLVAGLLFGRGLQPSPSVFKIDTELVQIFAASLVATCFLGITLIPSSSTQKTMLVTYAPVLMPLIYAIGSVILALLLTYVAENGNKLLHWASEMGALAALLLWTRWLVSTFMPVFWVKNGKEYSAEEFTYLWQLSILIGYLTSKVEKAYQIAAKRYADYFSNTSAWYLYNVHYFMSFLPTVGMLVAFIYGYFKGGLYGTGISVLGIASFFRTGSTSIHYSLFGKYLFKSQRSAVTGRVPKSSYPAINSY
ncbi:MAG: hypothetical protein RMJ44_08615 [Cytophagales bacterium]|nr:hypothetical protein [Cytophagales bacterium]